MLSGTLKTNTQKKSSQRTITEIRVSPPHNLHNVQDGVQNNWTHDEPGNGIPLQERKSGKTNVRKSRGGF